MNEFNLRLDLDKSSAIQVVTLRQGDVDGTTVSATVYDHGALADLSGISSAYIEFALPDGTHYYRGSASVSGSVVTALVDESQAASVPGRACNAYFSLSDGTHEYSTASFVVAVLPDATDGLTPGETYDSAIQAAIDAAMAAAQQTIPDGGVTTAKLATGAVTTAKIDSNAVTTAKIADENVTTAKLADGAATTAKIADDAVTGVKIADGAVTHDKLADAVRRGYVRSFETVAAMQASTTLVLGTVCHTNGFHSAGDGGAAYYTISASGTANGMDVLACTGGLFAALVDGDTVDVMQHGATQGTTDSLTVFRYCLDKAQTENKTVMALGEYTLSGQLLFDSNYHETLIVGKLNFPSSDGLVIANQYKTVLIRDGITANGRCVYIAGNTTVSPRYIQRVKVAGYENNKPVLMSSTAACMEVESNNRGVAYLAFDNLICGSEKTSASPALYMHADTGSSFANNCYFNDCCFNVCGDDRWMAELHGLTAFTIESCYFLNTSFESAESNAAGGLLLRNICGCSFINCRYEEHYIRSGKKYMRLEGRTYNNVFDTGLTSAMEAFDLALTEDVPFAYNRFPCSRLVKTINSTVVSLCDGFMIASDNTFRFGEPLRQRSHYIVNTGSSDKTIGIEANDAACCAYYPRVWLSNESASITITLTMSFIRQFASFDLHWSYYYRPTTSKTVTIKTENGQILDTLNSTFTQSGQFAHVHYDFMQQYGSVSTVYKSTEVIANYQPTTS